MLWSRLEPRSQSSASSKSGSSQTSTLLKMRCSRMLLTDNVAKLTKFMSKSQKKWQKLQLRW